MHVRTLHVIALLAAAASLGACSNDHATSLPFAGIPNAGGGSTGTNQPGSSSAAGLRFIAADPDAAAVDACIDQAVFTPASPTRTYGSASAVFAVPGGITHTFSVYPTPASNAGGPGAECGTAPGPYFGVTALATTTIAPGVGEAPLAETLVLAGTTGSKTLGLYVFGEPASPVTPAAYNVSAHNAAPAYSAATPSSSVGFGDVSVQGTAASLPGANAVGAPVVAQPSSAALNPSVHATLGTPPASFYAGAGDPSGAVAPAATAPAPAASAGQAYLVELFAIDAPGGGLGLVVVPAGAAGSSP